MSAFRNIVGKLVALALAGAACPADAQTIEDPAQSNLVFRLRTAAAAATNSHDCPSSRQTRYAKDFGRRYGKRIERLTRTHLARSGKDPEVPDFVIIGSCRISVASLADQDARHRKAMRDFESMLRALEKEFGGY